MPPYKHKKRVQMRSALTDRPQELQQLGANRGTKPGFTYVLASQAYSQDTFQMKRGRKNEEEARGGSAKKPAVDKSISPPEEDFPSNSLNKEDGSVSKSSALRQVKMSGDINQLQTQASRSDFNAAGARSSARSIEEFRHLTKSEQEPGGLRQRSHSSQFATEAPTSAILGQMVRHAQNEDLRGPHAYQAIQHLLDASRHQPGLMNPDLFQRHQQLTTSAILQALATDNMLARARENMLLAGGNSLSNALGLSQRRGVLPPHLEFGFDPNTLSRAQHQANVRTPTVIPGSFSRNLGVANGTVNTNAMLPVLPQRVLLPGEATRQASSGRIPQGIPPNTQPIPTPIEKSALGQTKDERGGLAVSTSSERLESSAVSRSRPREGDDSYRPGKIVPMALPSDEGILSEYQCMVRKQILLFEATNADIQCSAQGRNMPIVLGQVGVLCCHCAALAPGRRTRGAVYFPAKLMGFYQAAQNMVTNHLTNSCTLIPSQMRERLLLLKRKKSTCWGGGKEYWANGARVLGVKESNHGLVFEEASSAEAKGSLIKNEDT